MNITQLPPFEVFNLQPKSTIPGDGYVFADGITGTESDRFAAWSQGIFGPLGMTRLANTVIAIALDPEMHPMVTPVLDCWGNLHNIFACPMVLEQEHKLAVAFFQRGPIYEIKEGFLERMADPTLPTWHHILVPVSRAYEDWRHNHIP